MYKLVIIDDEKIICDLLKRLIAWEELGLEFAGMAHDGYSALDLIREKRPDIVIIDIRIPGMDGIEVIEKAQKLSENTRFLVVSGYREFDYARQACFLNVANYLVKPIDEKELNASLRQPNSGQAASSALAWPGRSISGMTSIPFSPAKRTISRISSCV